MPQRSEQTQPGEVIALPPAEPPASASWQNRIAVCGLALLLILLGARYVVMVQPRAMEFDQICTLLTAEAPSWHAYITAVPADSQPPFSHVAARLGLLLPMPESIGLHMVSALAIALAAACLFRLFQRRGAPLAGLCSAAFLIASRCIEYMFTIRPYAALLAVSALSLLVYDAYRTRRGERRRASLWPLTLIVVLAATIHALSLVYVLLPIGAGELLYWVRKRRIDARLLAAVMLASTAFLFDFTLARQIQTHYMSLVPLSARVPGLPTASKLVEVLTTPVERRWQGLLLALVLLVALIPFVQSKMHTAERQEAHTPDRLFPALAAVALYVAGTAAFAMGALNHYFFTRYASPVFLCGALLLGVVLTTAPCRRWPAATLLIATALLLLPVPAFAKFVAKERNGSPREDYASLFEYGDIIASPLAFPTLWWYATPVERHHMRVMTDADRYRTIPDGIPEAVLQRFAAAGVLPFRLTHFRELQLDREVTLVMPKLSGDTWLPAVLAEKGYTCAPEVTFHSAAWAMQRCVLGGAGQWQDCCFQSGDLRCLPIRSRAGVIARTQ